MSSAKKMLLSAAGNAGGSTDVSDVFSTFSYKGTNGDNHAIVNGIDLSGEGGLVWIKSRQVARSHALYDTARGVHKYLQSNTADAQVDLTNANDKGVKAFNANGFTMDDDALVNADEDLVSWTFRKAPKFFDIVTYTGDGNATLINHNLGSVPGMIIVKCTSEAGPGWPVFHRALDGSAAQDYVLNLRATSARADGGNHWYNFAPTATQFKVGPINDTNTNGYTYVAYLFAHNDGDGEFGPDGDQDIIKCGSYTGNGSTSSGPHIDLGFEPQWILVKTTTQAGNWSISDKMRGFHNQNQINLLYPHLNNAEGVISTTPSQAAPTSTGFQVQASGTNFNTNGETYIYMAIRAPMITEPEAATDVFKGYSMTGLNANAVVDIDFPPDMVLHMHALGGKYVFTRLIGSFINKGSAGSSVRNWLQTNTSAAMETGTHGIYYDNNSTSLKLNTNYGGSSNADITSFQWKRAKGYFDVVAYTGTGSARTVAHSLGVAPEMMWVKSRNATRSWSVFHSAPGPTKGGLGLNLTSAASDDNTVWNDTSPTSTVFTVGTYGNVNTSGNTYVAYLFATLAGISKVGSVAHSGSSTDVDCGFSNGARFVLLKRTDAAGHWYIFDTISGIVAGNDPYYSLDSADTISGINYAHQITNSDFIDPLSSGFQISGDFADGTYLFYAIA